MLDTGLSMQSVLPHHDKGFLMVVVMTKCSVLDIKTHIQTYRVYNVTDHDGNGLCGLVTI
jgi:hypothetical protein